ncbi:uncharacterized protein LOC124276334 isoform X2 [Haliotis rubra]|uniref:uncharacterized protein LOC124276334 isoform X2 n=1 Tax=Haliotis rubra TaxID=36100 RepID=UPI001EE57F3B|nr:uncharacterized protein LOC124276334 isoform X2 [Haliotis rubra]XP_046567916.1 uncharacterized protein LOC124276334 isoform X2 [Haliotis rubra]XP_046567917.1 uncharacterized protein LOC124276334 isoform X2 [Haliotis rubra]
MGLTVDGAAGETALMDDVPYWPMVEPSTVRREHPQQSAAELTPDCGRWQISPYFHAGVAVLAAVIAVIVVVSVIRLKARQTRSQRKIDAVEKPHSCEESHRFLAAKSNINSVIPPSRADEGGGRGPVTCVTEMGILFQNNH